MLPAGVRTPLDGRPLAREGAVAAALFGGFVLWVQVLLKIGSRFANATEPFVPIGWDAWPLVNNALLIDVVVVAGMVAFAVTYVRIRGLFVPVAVPDRSRLELVATAVALPAAAVTAVYGLAHATGTTLSAIDGTFVAGDASLVLPAVVTALELLLGLPAYLLLAHVLVQGTLRTATRAPVAIGLTTLVVGLIGPTELVGTGSLLPTLVVTVLLPVSIALPVYAAHSFEEEWLPWVCAVPFALFGVGLVRSWLVDVQGVAGAAFNLVAVAVVALGAYGYEETDSLLPAALAYVTYVVATEAIIVFVETGVGP